MSKKTKRLLLLNLPYVLFALLGTKLGQAWRLAPGSGFSEKFLHLMEGRHGRRLSDGYAQLSAL